MIRPEVEDPCVCRTCASCRNGICSGCSHVYCLHANRRHDCACQNAACVARRAA